MMSDEELDFALEMLDDPMHAVMNRRLIADYRRMRAAIRRRAHRQADACCWNGLPQDPDCCTPETCIWREVRDVR